MNDATEFGIERTMLFIPINTVRQNINNENRYINIIENTLEKLLVFKQLLFEVPTDTFP